MKFLSSLVILFLPFVVPISLRAEGKEQPAVRIALVSSDKSESARTIMSLAEVRLSNVPGLVLVDRQAIDKVLAEQKLTLAGVVSAEQALSLGKLLSVDLFGVVEVGVEAKGVAGLVVFDARTGVRLVDTALPSDTTAASVDAVVAAVQSAQRKNIDLAQLRPICLMAVRNADLPRDLDLFCDSVGMLLERRLSASPDLAVLERRRLEQVNQERDLPVNSPLRTLLASVLVVELDIGVAMDSKGLRATALLSDGRGRSLGKVTATVPNRNAADLAQALSRELAVKLDKKLGAAPVAATRSLEALRFLHEQQYFTAHTDFVRAIRAAESAFALCPEDARTRATLAYVLSLYAWRLINPSYPSQSGASFNPLKVDSRAVDLSFAIMRRVNVLWIDIETLVLDARIPKVVVETRGAIKSIIANYWGQLLRLQQQDLSDEQLTVIKDLLAQQKQAYIIGIRRAREAIVDKTSFDLYTRELQSFLSSRGGNKYVKDTDWVEEVQQLSDWAILAGKQGDDLSHSSMDFLWTAVQTCDLPNENPRYRQLPPAAVERLQRMWAELETHSNRRVALYGRIGGVVFALAFARLPDQVAHARLRAMRLSIEAELKANPALSSDMRNTLYRTGTDLFSRRHMPGALDELTEFCEFMLARKDLYFRLVTASAECIYYIRPLTEEKQRYVFNVLQRSLELLESNQAHLINDQDGRSIQMEQTIFRNHCVELQAQIRAETPSAAPPLEPRWESAVPVLDVYSHTTGILWLIQPIVHNGSIYVTAVRREGSPAQYALQLLRLTPGQPRAWHGKPIEIPAPDFAGRPSNGPDRSRLPQFASSVCIHDGRYYLGTKANGIYVMPLDDSQPAHIATADGLPSDIVQSLVGSGGRLYACLGDSQASYIVSWDLKAARCDILASSRRTDKRSPFDNAPPFTCRVILPDPMRRRLVFLTSSHGGSSVLSGIWALEPEDGTFKQLLPLSGASAGLFSESASIEGNQLLLNFGMGVLTYDLEKKEPILLYAGKTVLHAGKPPDVALQLETLPDYHLTRSDFMNVRAPHLVVDDWVWGSFPFSRRRIQDGKAEMLPPLRPGARNFQPTMIQPFGKDGQLLIADPFTVWIVNLPKK